MTKVHTINRAPEHGPNTSPNLLFIYFEDGSFMTMNVQPSMSEDNVEALVHDVAGQRPVSTIERC